MLPDQLTSRGQGKVFLYFSVTCFQADLVNGLSHTYVAAKQQVSSDHQECAHQA